MVTFVADEFANNITLLQNLGTEHKLGGAEQDDAAMLWYLSEALGEEIPRIQCPELSPPMIDPDEFYIIGNFGTLSEDCKDTFGKYKNYLLYEHDHKYCKGRNPMHFKDFVAPSDQTCNTSFYNHAALVMCMTKFHQGIVLRNVYCKTDHVGGSFWMPEELDMIQSLSGIPKQDKCFIYDNESYHKGLQESIDYCKLRGWEYDLVPNQPTREGYLRKLASYKTLVFMPQSPETCSRLVVEAKMMGVDVHTRSYVGALHEPWYKLRWDRLVSEMRHHVMPRAIKLLRATCEHHSRSRISPS